MNISFKAGFTTTTTVPLNNNTQEYPVSFVELDYRNIEDNYAMNKIANNYTRIVADQNKHKDKPNGVNYFIDIKNHFNRASISPNFYPNSRFFAITTQGDTFEYLDNQKVLGLTEIWLNPLGNHLEIKYLQVNPLHKHGETTREYTHIGTKILDCIRNYFPDKDIQLVSDFDVIDFYKKYGFKVLRENQMILKCK